MSKQNIYDNEIFFEQYKNIRKHEANANNLFEKPALFSLLPDLHGKTILDLGCGYGEHCMHYIKNGAEKVVGIDISEKMLEVARTEYANPNITYIHMPMEDILKIGGKYDIIVSSLAIHYVKDFKALVQNVYELLNDNGIFIFSQENPINTCFSTGNRWTKDEKGNKLYANLSNYGIEGERKSTWFVDGVEKYHRTFSTIINTLTETGFSIVKMLEPLPTEEILKQYPEYKDLYHRPDFLLLKLKKN